MFMNIRFKSVDTISDNIRKTVPHTNIASEIPIFIAMYCALH